MKLANDLMKGAKQAKEHAEEMNLLDRQFAGLNMKEMTNLEPSSAEFKECDQYLSRTVGATHGTNYRVRAVFTRPRLLTRNRSKTSSESSERAKETASRIRRTLAGQIQIGDYCGTGLE